MITVVLASIDSKQTIAASVQGFMRELDGRGRVVVADASRDGSAGYVPKGVAVTWHPLGTLAPELWREGLIRSNSEFVAFSTAQMIPRSGWLDGLLARLATGDASGVGGPIAAGQSLSAVDRALYLLRYASYLPPVPESSSFDPPGDNAIYRKADLDAVAPSWHEGFWEVEVHAALRSLGKSVTMDSSAIVDFVGGCQFQSALRHRLAHARRYGAGRSEGLRIAARAGRALAAPLVPPLLLARIVRNLRSRGEPMARWFPALPHLGALLATWSLGEAWGTIGGSGRCRQSDLDCDTSLEVIASGVAST